MFTELILDKLGVFYDDIAKKKHGNCPEITYGYLINTIINTPKTSAYKLFPELGEQTFNRMMKRIFPAIKLQGGNGTWCYYLLSIINSKYCYGCNIIKNYDEYHKDTNLSSGIASLCKECKSIKQAGSYKKYISAHKKSYVRNSGKIRARNITSKFNRAKRNVGWDSKEALATFYSNCPVGYHVDHIIPLQGELVSGLHILANLQYLPANENLVKGNKFVI